MRRERYHGATNDFNGTIFRKLEKKGAAIRCDELNEFIISLIGLLSRFLLQTRDVIEFISTRVQAQFVDLFRSEV